MLAETMSHNTVEIIIIYIIQIRANVKADGA